jgi:hypothetical protein
LGRWCRTREITVLQTPHLDQGLGVGGGKLVDRRVQLSIHFIAVWRSGLVIGNIHLSILDKIASAGRKIMVKEQNPDN